MKKFIAKLFLILISGCACLNSLSAQTAGSGWNQTSTGNMILSDPNAAVGIGVSTPTAKVHVSGSFLLEGITGNTPVSGAGTRMMWVPAKSAFRAGSVSGTEWDDTQIGIGSVGLGKNTLASGTNAFAFGNGVQATAANSMAFGFGKFDLTGNLIQPAINAKPNSFAIFMGGNTPVIEYDPLDNAMIIPVECEVEGFFNNGVLNAATNVRIQSGGDNCRGFLCADRDISAERFEARKSVDFTGVGCLDALLTPGFRIWRNDATSLEFGSLTVQNPFNLLQNSHMRLLNNGTFEIGNGLNRSDYALTINGKPNPNNQLGDMRDKRSVYTNGSVTIDRDLLSGEYYTGCFNVNLTGNDDYAKGTTKTFGLSTTIGQAAVSTAIMGNGDVVSNAAIKMEKNLQANQGYSFQYKSILTGDQTSCDQTRSIDLSNNGSTRFQVMGNGNTFVAGNVGIGVENPAQRLVVDGMICSKESRVSLTGLPCAWPDFVFEPNYQLMPLNKLETYLKENKHLPGIPSAQTVEQDGIELGKMNALLLQKIEELTLHLIEQQKQIEALQTKVNTSK